MIETEQKELDLDIKNKNPEEIAHKFNIRPGKGGKEGKGKPPAKEEPKKGAKELAPVKGGKKNLKK